jgi:hypothetical protein
MYSISLNSKRSHSEPDVHRIYLRIIALREYLSDKSLNKNKFAVEYMLLLSEIS